MKIKEIILENKINVNDIFDDHYGLGATPDNLNVDYKGLRVLMLPSTFLKLAMETEYYESVEFIKKHILRGGKIGHPFLILEIPESWERNKFLKMASVESHEGRNRTKAILEIFGDVPIEVHIFAPTYRRHHFNDEWLENIKNQLMSENKKIIKNPIIKILK